MDITSASDPSEVNHVRTEYTVANIWLQYPTKMKSLTFVNGTESERTIAAGTLIGILGSDQTIGQPVKSDGTDGSQKPFGAVINDIVIGAGAAVEADGLVGWNGIIYADKVVLEKTNDTLDTLITEENQSIRNSLLNNNALLQIEEAAENVSAAMNSQV